MNTTLFRNLLLYDNLKLVSGEVSAGNVEMEISVLLFNVSYY